MYPEGIGALHRCDQARCLVRLAAWAWGPPESRSWIGSTTMRAMSVLLTRISELANESIRLDADDLRAETRANTWWISADGDERAAVTGDQIVEAFSGVVSRLRMRDELRSGEHVVTFYVWNDRQASQLRCSIGSVAADELPFGAPYEVTNDLQAIAREFLDDLDHIPWGELHAVDANMSDEDAPRPPLAVWSTPLS